MTRYQVDSEAVLSATATVRGSMERIRSEVSALTNQLSNLQSSWSGQAAAAFQSAVSDWRATEVQVSQNLEALNQGLTMAGQQYSDIEQANARLFSR